MKAILSYALIAAITCAVTINTVNVQDLLPTNNAYASLTAEQTSAVVHDVDVAYSLEHFDEFIIEQTNIALSEVDQTVFNMLGNEIKAKYPEKYKSLAHGYQIWTMRLRYLICTSGQTLTRTIRAHRE